VRGNASGSNESGASALQLALGSGRAAGSQPQQRETVAPQQSNPPRATPSDASNANETSATSKQTKPSNTTPPSTEEETLAASFEQALAASLSESASGAPPAGSVPARGPKSKAANAQTSADAASLAATLSLLPAGLLAALPAPSPVPAQSEAGAPVADKLIGATTATSVTVPQLRGELEADLGDGSPSTATPATAGASPTSAHTDSTHIGVDAALPAPSSTTTTTTSSALAPTLQSVPALQASGASTDGAPAVTHSGAQALMDLQQTLVDLKAQIPAANSQNTDDTTDAAGDSANGAAASFGAQVPTNAATHAEALSANTQPIQSHVGSSAWSDEIGARLMLMAQRGVASASLRLAPEHLGPLDVRISMRDSTASVWFGAAQPDTRAALEQALPRLRELFAAQGLNLTHAGVSGESSRDAAQNPQTAGTLPCDASREVDAAPFSSAPSARKGLIDTYA
jgi:flagellar hook-length control protein FliK